MNCNKCGKELEEKTAFCPYCGAPLNEKEQVGDGEQVESKNIEVKEDVTNQSSKVKKQMNKNKLIIIGFIALLAIAGIGFGMKTYLDNKAREEYVMNYNQYVDDIGVLKIKMLGGAANAEKVCNLTLKVWSNAIWETFDTKTDKYVKPNGKFVSDFNEALTNMTKDQTVMNDRVALSLHIDETQEIMDKMKNPPEGLEDKYETLKEMFDMYEEFLEAAVTPSGSYKSYNENVNDLDSDFMKLYNKVDKFDLNHISK